MGLNSKIYICNTFSGKFVGLFDLVFGDIVHFQLQINISSRNLEIKQWTINKD
jgi:hypothetical protein